MMRILTFAILLCMLCSTAFSDVIVIYDKNTKAILTMSEKDDTALGAGQEKAILPGTFENYDFAENPTLYDYKNGKFVLNTTRVSDKEKAKQDNIELDAEKKLVADYLQNTAITELEKQGISFKHLKKGE